MSEPKVTRMELLIQETIRPVVAAADQLIQEIRESLRIPDAPWKILNKKYDELTDQEIGALYDIYHQEGEVDPCPMCKWVAREELSRMKNV